MKGKMKMTKKMTDIKKSNRITVDIKESKAFRKGVKPINSVSNPKPPRGGTSQSSKNKK
jgi:hypothetical protein